jgi:hypothetical protein
MREYTNIAATDDLCSAAVPAAVVGATAGKMPALHG